MVTDGAGAIDRASARRCHQPGIKARPVSTTSARSGRRRWRITQGQRRDPAGAQDLVAALSGNQGAAAGGLEDRPQQVQRGRPREPVDPEARDAVGQSRPSRSVIRTSMRSRTPRWSRTSRCHEDSSVSADPGWMAVIGTGAGRPVRRATVPPLPAAPELSRPPENDTKTGPAASASVSTRSRCRRAPIRSVGRGRPVANPVSRTARPRGRSAG